MEIVSDSIIAVVGAGTMGMGIAQIAATAGHRVYVIDTQKEALDRGRTGVEKALAAQERRGAIDAVSRSAIEARITWTTDIAAAAPATITIEAIVERLSAKTALFRTLAGIVAPDAILATNTSSLSIEAIAATISGPERFVGLHFFNPVPAMKLVEIVGNSRGDPAITDALFTLMQRWGKRPVAVRDVPGFIVNRVARPYYAEGFLALGEGIDAALIDQALTGAGGFRMGPLALADMIGHDVNFAVARSVFEAYEGKTRFRPQPMQQALFDSGRLGRKTGSGVYDYAVDLPVPLPVPPGDPIGSILAATEHALLTPLLDAARATGLDVKYSPGLAVNSFVVGGKTLALGDGRTLADRPDTHVLIDHARDFNTTALLVITSHDPPAAAIAAAFARAIGKFAIAIPDRPGQIVLRTLAQLANAAADAVADDVASTDGIDQAMQFGANHPEGPLAWARRTGAPSVTMALSNIATATNDPLYEPAPYFSSFQA